MLRGALFQPLQPLRRSTALDLAAVSQAIATAYQPPQGAGRPSAIADPASLQIFLAELEHGVHLEPAAQLAGLAPNTVRAWLKRGEDGEKPFDLFLLAFKRAQGAIEARVTKNIIRASEDSRFWAAGATYLERTHPDRWARRSDDSSAPKVVVQIGVRDSDVQVSIQGPTEAPRALHE